MRLPRDSQKFELDCQLRDWKNSTDLQDMPRVEEFHRYWYDTGPGNIFNEFINIKSTQEPSQTECNSTSSHTVLIKREGAFNLWHSLMEIFSYTLTMDVLSLTRDPSTNEIFFTPSDAETTQIVLLDSSPPGPYFELWQLLAKRPVQLFQDLQTSNPGTCLKNLIVPLPGSSNPLWQADWIAFDCKSSKLLSAFVSRVLSHFSITPSRDPASPLVLTFINRTSTRRLLSQDIFLSNLTNLYPNITIQSIDFAAISLKEQLTVAQNTDILVGVHGAGLTHAMFLPQRSAIVEILPEGLMHKGFANVAKIRELNYFSAHGESVEVIEGSGEDWHGQDVYLEENRFLDIMDVAIKSVYHTRLLEIDAV
ncbi:hypothetical protein B7494_g8387 [Chlorociboria aeruginascens]|nr:hypothetical protein B7494_g8387 [Chlorociboria aeruginascens]